MYYIIPKVKKIKVKNKIKNAEKIVTITKYRYYISNKQVNIKECIIDTRQHWAVKNNITSTKILHQNNTTTKNKKSLLKLEIIHKFVLTILNKEKPI